MKNSIFLILFAIITFQMGCSRDDTNLSAFEEAFLDADASKGGIMYDKFWAVEAQFNQLDPDVAKFSAKADFFRCKQCHGWDLKGSKGAYINRKPKTNRPNVSSLDLNEIRTTKTAEELYNDLIRKEGRRTLNEDLSSYDPDTNPTVGDQMPNLTEFMTDAQIMDLVKFLKEGAFDVTELYDFTTSGSYPTGSITYSNIGKDGNPASGKTFYTNNCASCHGVKGTQIDLGGRSAGQFLRSKPYEVHHKVKYGQLGSSMVGEFDMTIKQMKDLFKALTNETDFPDMPEVVAAQ